MNTTLMWERFQRDQIHCPSCEIELTAESLEEAKRALGMSPNERFTHGWMLFCEQCSLAIDREAEESAKARKRVKARVRKYRSRQQDGRPLPASEELTYETTKLPPRA